jgi:cytochrome c-type biogenesis protein CcmH/NrfG
VKTAFAAALSAALVGLASQSPAAETGGTSAKASPAEAAYAEGVALLGTKQYAQAAEKFEATVTADPKNAGAWYQLGSARRRSGRCDRAVIAYRRFLSLAPDTPAPYYGLGLCLKETGDRPGALQSLKHYVSIESATESKKFIEHANSVIAELSAPAGPAPAAADKAGAPGAASAAAAKPPAPWPGSAAYAEAQTLRDKGHIDEAIAKFRQSIAADPRNALPRVALGELFLKIRRDDEAIETLRAAVEKNPTHPLAWYDLAFAYRTKNRMKDAVDAYEHYIKLRPTDPDPYYGLARALEQMGRKAAAKQAYETYVDMEKNPSEKRWVDSARTQIQALASAP